MKKLVFIIVCFLSCESYQSPIKKTDVESESEMSSVKGQLNPDVIKVQKIEKLFSEYVSDFPRAKNILISDLEKLNSEDVIFVDVREPRETEVSMIKGALTQKEFEKNKKSYKDHLVVVYCTIGYRSGKYSQQLLDKNFKAFNLQGGVLLWSHDKRGFVRGQQETKSVHVYGKTWDLLHSDYNAIY